MGKETWIFEAVLLLPWLLMLLGLIAEKLFGQKGFLLFPISLFILLPTGILVAALQVFNTPFTSKLLGLGLSRLRVRLLTRINILMGIVGWMLIYVATA